MTYSTKLLNNNKNRSLINVVSEGDNQRIDSQRLAEIGQILAKAIYRLRNRDENRDKEKEEKERILT